ncbi:MAG: branched-chain amino acid ABC transporter permease [Armatimonadota bacterium]|nr:branched-chain amino acid ABC transporter permease [Armatimonadota bacterium]MDR7449601.1 branched-chain amino acid ABC transporter permease [Armatimonadota bacterium]MDR7460360.1 branched-chain amino acid ABC transporter permease [Armatimonadota bacterium]MDR7488093.1 branched-chain amino acid ABC transporter permease [Armatimonadota bacterium]MDR7492128.1 branched-chain amino acid ABC transporter permease [Armatimonadota bacterium]
MTILLQNLMFGLLIGGLYGLAAVGLSLVFGVLRVLNVAHGDLIMLGGYATFWLFAWWGIDPFLAAVVSALLLFGVGVVLYQGAFRPLAAFHEEARVKTSILVGFGLALALHSAAILAWEADERAVTAYAGQVLPVGPVVVPLARLGGFVAAVVTLGGLHLFLTRTRTGRAIRATAEDREAAMLMGVPVGRIFVVAFGLGSALAGVAGSLVTLADAISPAIGLFWTLKALIVVVLGGMGHILGTFVAGLFLGVAEALSGFLAGNVYREVVGLVLFLLVLTLRPEGLFARR